MSLTRRLGRTCTALLCVTALLFASWTGSASAAEKKDNKAAQVDLAKQSVSAVLMDQATGTVLFEKNAHQKLPPASVTKVMTMLLIMEAVENGKVKWSDKIRTSENAASMGGSQIFLEPGEEMSLEEMFKGIAVASGNDAAVAVAEHLAGSEESFVQLMNERAEQLGSKNTHFSNVNGLPVENHYTSAYDIALMSRELLKHEGVTKFTGLYQDYLRKSSEKPFWLVNTNKLVRFYTGMDGLKTGFTAEAKYCLSATAKRGGFRVIAVAMGAPTSPVRNAEISQMMDYAFANFKSEVLYKPGQVVQQVMIDKGDVRSLPIITRDTVGVLMKKGDKKAAYQQEVVLNDVKAPIKKGQVLGSVVIKKDGQEIAKSDLVASLDVSKAGMWTMFKRTVESWLTFGS
ncbi:D-alanyl-D-alanine carboxypeptidase (penicillin-binding protein 5/6) [Tumebacillus sp. BK434]|uniref:D-alanyl-D-alanine carboxypeptidase family protein n=1 Tax=Tumebacillus sp. BK434 TaxID=2512169 RepID=UPI0010527ED6|nr:D-alanyl-D-alanine carboxypeptidase family protein [Tumebacillus sp. BK434]TCP59562.1 D-alanyl-D-alanine carboxypeptidase (penicillin-binding protein 5/6) [Tumebacillus sp. BK434]